MNEHESEILADWLTPPVKSFELVSQEFFRIEDGCRIILKGAVSPEVKTMVKEAVHRYWQCGCAVELVEEQVTVPAEGYELKSTQESLTLTASDLAGFRNALRTCRQLAEPSRGVMTTQYYILACVSISDAPDMAFRGIHICWFPETPAWEIEKQLRLAAYYKFNYAVLECWGVLELKCHPEFCWDEYRVPQTEIHRLVKLGKDLGITLIPQVNVFGHAPAARHGTGKHVLLDFHPEFAPLFEPDGWTWCIANPATRQFLTDVLLEIYELYERPPFFHVGCDEAYSMGQCALCRRANYAELFKAHLTYFRDLFAARGTRIMMWHDMLLTYEDPRWKGYTVCGHEADGMQKLHRELPKDIVICDWQYNYPEGPDGSEPTWPTSSFFKENGFDVLTCPWINVKGTTSLGRFSKREGLMGMLCTTWHQNRSVYLWNIYYFGARATWNAEGRDSKAYAVTINRHVWEVNQDMGIKHYVEAGTTQYQITPAPYQGQGF